MLVKVLKMQGGEQVISGIAEVTNENNEGVGFELTHPYLLDLIPTGELSPDGQPTTFNVNFTRWVSCSVDTTFRIPYSTLVAIGEPEQTVLDTYKAKFGDLFNDDDAVQPSDSSDSSEESGVSDIGD
jgi:hypothetical protein